jgi:hypothetical protein
MLLMRIVAEYQGPFSFPPQTSMPQEGSYA